MTPEQLEQLRARLVKDLAIADLPDSAQDLVITQLNENVLLALTRATESRIPATLRTEYEQAQTSGSPEMLQNFYEQAIPGYDKLVENVIQAVVLDHQKGEPVAA